MLDSSTSPFISKLEKVNVVNIGRSENAPASMIAMLLRDKSTAVNFDNPSNASDFTSVIALYDKSLHTARTTHARPNHNGKKVTRTQRWDRDGAC